MVKILDGLSPESLVLQRGQRVVCSTSPNRTQVPLGSRAQSVISDLVATRNSVSDILQSAIATRREHLLKDTVDAPFNDPIVLPFRGFYKADLSIASGDDAGALEIRLTLLSQNGEVVFQSHNLTVRPIWKEGQTSPESLPKAKVPVSPAAKAFRKLYASQTAGRGAPIEVSPVLEAHLLNLEHSDPLSLSTSDALLSMAKFEEKPLVALVPDSAFGDRLPEDATMTVGDFLQSLWQEDTMTMTTAEGWVEITPVNPSSERKYRCDRKVR